MSLDIQHISSLPNKKTDRVVFVSGIFNVLHPGHVRLLRFAKECGHRLLVAVLSDRIAANSAHIPQQLRLEGILSNSWVDDVFILDEPVEKVIALLKPAMVVKGKEHESKYNPEQVVLEQYGGKLLFSSGEMGFSSIDLIRKEFITSGAGSIQLPLDFMKRHCIHSSRLADILQRFDQLNVCVIGDLIIDEYISCQPLGMSQEDPTIVVTPLDSTKFIGGAGIVAAHAAGLGASVDFISVTGSDPIRDFAHHELLKSDVHAHLLIDDNRPTTLKQRFRSQGKTLLRVSHLHQGAISLELQKQVISRLEQTIAKSNLLVFSDFNYGVLPQILVDKAISIAKSHHVMMVADSQSSSQIGDISRFKSMSLITPTELEARISVRNSEDGLVVLAEKLKRNADARNILLKLGEEGLLIHAGNEENWLTDRVGALNSSPRDIAGAGDSLLIASALTLAGGGNIWEAACIGSLAAAVQVGRVGNTPIQIKEILREMG